MEILIGNLRESKKSLCYPCSSKTLFPHPKPRKNDLLSNLIRDFFFDTPQLQYFPSKSVCVPSKQVIKPLVKLKNETNTA